MANRDARMNWIDVAPDVAFVPALLIVLERACGSSSFIMEVITVVVDSCSAYFCD